MTRYHSVFGTLALLILTYLALTHYAVGDKPWIFYNSDNYIPYLYQDLVLHGGHVSQWNFAAVTDFFPDIILFFGIAFIVHSLPVTMLLFGALQLILFYFLIMWIGSRLILDSKKRCLFSLSALSAIFLLSTGQFTHIEIFESALTSWLHFGTVLMYLLGFLLVVRSYQTKNIFNYILLFIICFFTTFSDLLHIVQFSLPAAVSLILLFLLGDNQNRNTTLCNFGVIFFATLLGFLFYKTNPFGIQFIHENEVLKRIHPADLVAALSKLRDVLSAFFQSNAIILFLDIIFMVVGTQYLYRLITKNNKETVEMNFAFIFLYFTVWVGIFSLIFLDNDLMIPNYVGMRHYQPFILLPAFLGIPLYFARFTQLGELANKRYILLVVLMVVCAYLFGQGKSLKRIINFYPPSIACIDHYAEQYHLENGLANYWEAKSYHRLSKKQLNIVAMTQEIKPYKNISTTRDYENKQFTFVVIPNEHTLEPSYPAGLSGRYLTEKQVIQLVGKPFKILTCPTPLMDGEEKIYIFNKPIRG